MNPLVSLAWLAGRLGDPSVVILDATLPPVGVTPPVDTRGCWLERHIPGAVFFDINALSEQATSLPHMLPSEEQFSRDLSALGVGDGMTIVVYEQDGVFSAPRAWWMLRTFGAKDVRLLDGALRSWTEADLPVESGPVERAPATFTARPDRGAVKNFDQVRQLLDERAQVVDARSAGRFHGTAPEPRAGLSSGHMPGALNVPYTELVEYGRLKQPEVLRAVFAKHGIDLKRPATTTCGSGVTAAVVELGMLLAGATEVTLYDGSWTEYAQRPEAVIEKD